MLTDLSAIRDNLRRWAQSAPITGAWAALADPELAARVESVSSIKRFVERYCIDGKFRDAVRCDPEDAFKRADTRLDTDCLRELASIDTPRGLSEDPCRPVSPAIQHYLDFARERFDWPELRELAAQSTNPRYRAWREQQIARCRFEFAPGAAARNAHISWCVELSKGCSVGCNFCGLAAPALDGHFRYTPANAALWRALLALMQELLGPAAGSGFCYWATDPFDNPDYERFVSDFHDILGVFPQTTTARPQYEMPRLRAFFADALAKGCKLNRISVLSPSMLSRLHENFRPEELTFTGIVAVAPNARDVVGFPFRTVAMNKVNAGRALLRRVGKEPAVGTDSRNGSIACVSGFLFNLVDRSVRLISPCNAGSRWPHGYVVFDEGLFADVAGLKTLLEGMIARHMAPQPNADDVVRFRAELDYRATLDGFRLSSAWNEMAVRHSFNFPGVLNCLWLGETIRNGGHTLTEIVQQFERRGVNGATTMEYVNLLYRNGVLDNAPATRMRTI